MKENNSMKKNNKVLIVALVFAVILAVAGGTFAYWSWDSTVNTNVTFSITPDFSCSANGGGDINGGGLAPTYDCNSEYAIKREITYESKIENASFGVDMNLWLEVNSIAPGLSESENLRYVVTNSANSCTTGIVSEGISSLFVI